MERRHVPTIPLVLSVLCLSACSHAAPGASTSLDAGDAVDAGASVFVAFESDFSGFRQWHSTPGVPPDGAPPPPEGDGGVHIGPLTTYINELPPPGSTSLPVRTIIVKESDSPPLTERQIFAMVKRGGGYNSGGATDWEWFELANIDETNVTILWRGIGPPGSESYGTNFNVCNDCHAMNAANDFVWTAGLELSKL